MSRDGDEDFERPRDRDGVGVGKVDWCGDISFVCLGEADEYAVCLGDEGGVSELEGIWSWDGDEDLERCLDWDEEVVGKEERYADGADIIFGDVNIFEDGLGDDGGVTDLEENWSGDGGEDLDRCWDGDEDGVWREERFGDWADIGFGDANEYEESLEDRGGLKV